MTTHPRRGASLFPPVLTEGLVIEWRRQTTPPAGKKCGACARPIGLDEAYAVVRFRGDPPHSKGLTRCDDCGRQFEADKAASRARSDAARTNVVPFPTEREPGSDG